MEDSDTRQVKAAFATTFQRTAPSADFPHQSDLHQVLDAVTGKENLP